MLNGTFLHSFIPILPSFHGRQADLVDWIVSKHGESLRMIQPGGDHLLEKLLKRFAVNESQINTRYFDTDREQIYQLDIHRLAGADILQRNLFFGQRVLEILDEMYANEKTPEHLIHVTCTGYLSPSCPQIYFSKKQLQPEITHAYHMGCYASLPAVRMAQAFAIGRGQLVDIVHNEICSLHLNPSQHSPEQIVVQTLFADGHIKYSLSEKSQGPSLKIISVKEKIIPDSEKDMTWIPSAVGMQMSLSKDVPEKIRDHLAPFIRELAHENNLDPAEMIRTSLFAIHPGGPKIIEKIEKKLELKSDQTVHCRNILKTRGNMSSATLPHVWKEILDSNYEGRVISLAFGPGLTIFGALFEARL